MRTLKRLLAVEVEDDTHLSSKDIYFWTEDEDWWVHVTEMMNGAVHARLIQGSLLPKDVLDMLP